MFFVKPLVHGKLGDLNKAVLELLISYKLQDCAIRELIIECDSLC
jgi:hypothetical protein